MADGDKYVFADVDMTIVDTVSYTNLIVGQTYTLKGVLMDKSTNAPLMIDGKEIKSEKTFTADKVNGTVDVEFVFDAIGLGDKELVVFEELYKGTELLDDHKDINDEGQTVEIVDNDGKSRNAKISKANRRSTKRGRQARTDCR